ncbi:MAG TPA: LysR family transcriptional regulator [Steroidobacteraceae bacterium]|jgi:DNA-binding transcriptional LysR family regulator
MALEPRQLRAFLAIVNTGSLGRAAQSLHLTQPALSRVVKQMEGQLRVQLFERRTTGMELTTFGKALLPYATHLTEEADLAIEEINVRLGLGRGTVRVGTVASAATVVLPALLDRFHRQWPNLQVLITEAVEDKLAAALVNNDVDVVLSGAIPETEEIVQVCEHRFNDRSVVIASATNPLHERRKVPLAELLEMPWAMPSSDAEPRKRFDALVQRLGGKPPRVALETRSPSTIKAVVAQTRFLGWLPEPLFAAEQAAGLIRPVRCEELVMLRRFFVYRRRRNFMAPPIQQFLQALQK